MASLVLTDNSQLTADGFEKLPDQIMYPYAEPFDLLKTCELTSGSPLAKVKMGWRSASLRQHPGRRQASLEMQLGDSSTSPKGGAETEPPTPPRKSNWEVIEHFNTSSTSSIRGRPTHSSSLIAGRAMHSSNLIVVRTLGRQQVVVIQVGGHALLQPHRGKDLSASAGGGNPGEWGVMHSSSLIAVRILGRQQVVVIQVGGSMHFSSLIAVGMSRGASIKEEEEDEEAADCEAGNLMNGDRRAPRDVQGDVESILLMTSSTNAGASWSQLRRLLHRLCRSHRFKNLEMAAIFVSDPRDNNNILLHTQDDPSSIPPEVIAIGMTLTCCITVYGGLMAILSRPALNELYLLGVSYVVLATFLALEMTLTSANERRTPSTGVWAAMFFIYLTYALLPIRLQEAAGAGTLFGVSQVVLSAYLNVENRHLLRQVRTVIWLQSQHTPIASGKDGDLVTVTTDISCVSCRHPSPPPTTLTVASGWRGHVRSFLYTIPLAPPQPPSTRADNEHEQLPNAMPPLREEDIKRVEE
uniref:Adenylate cyclase N-terminal domain-containing protein n=1 Tax=Timema genevievae TaxID=629358 RepID=A0A7R9JW79_TIMGE|nr:unnamed protein product [Timema genevievae]